MDKNRPLKLSDEIW